MLAVPGGVLVVPGTVEPFEGKVPGTDDVPGGKDGDIDPVDDVLSLEIAPSVPAPDFLLCFLCVVADGKVPLPDWSTPGVDVVDDLATWAVEAVPNSIATPITIIVFIV